MLFLKRFSIVVPPRLYAEASLSRGESYYKFDNLKVDWGRQDDYENFYNLG